MDMTTRRGTAVLVAAIAALTLVLAVWATTSFGADSSLAAATSTQPDTQFVQQDGRAPASDEEPRPGPGHDCPERDGEGEGSADDSSSPAPQASREPQL